MSGSEGRTPTTRGDAPRARDRAAKGLVRPGDRVGRFVVERVVGEGGMGVVYLAKDVGLQRPAVLKFLRAAAASELQQIRLLREAQAMARVVHPNVVAVYEVGEHRDAVFVAMEFVKGVNLADWLGRRELDCSEVLKLFLEAGRGLEAAHRVGLVHRDFKPHNVLVSERGEVKVTDFGLARAAGRSEDDQPGDGGSTGAEPASELLRLTLTGAGAWVGTPAYMAPEQVRGEPADAKADQFSYCVALYEGLCGRHPFADSDVAGIMKRISQGRLHPPDPTAGVPAEVLDLVLRGLETDVDARHPSMTSILEQLEEALKRRRRRHRLRALLGLAGPPAVVVAGSWTATAFGGPYLLGVGGVLVGALMWRLTKRDRAAAAARASGCQ